MTDRPTDLERGGRAEEREVPPPDAAPPPGNGAGSGLVQPTPSAPEEPALGRVTLLTRIGSTIFWTFLVFSCIVMFAGALVVFLTTALFDRKRRVQHLYSCFWAQLYFYVNPIWRLKIEGREHLPWNGPAVIVSNHQSLGDILVLFGLYRPYKWVSKASVFKVPILGWNMRFNRYVPLVRGDKASIARMMAQCRYWLEQGVPVLIFPEGTRSKDANLLPFKDGAFKLAVESGAPVIPIALTGTAATLPKHGYLIRQKADCRVRVLPPIDPAPFGEDVAALRDHVRDVIAAEKVRLDAEVRGEAQG
jgi:1-acyl-sn-glycerol-3-phosphate acyltransferase